MKYIKIPKCTYTINPLKSYFKTSITSAVHIIQCFIWTQKLFPKKALCFYTCFPVVKRLLLGIGMGYGSKSPSDGSITPTVNDAIQVQLCRRSRCLEAFEL